MWKSHCPGRWLEHTAKLIFRRNHQFGRTHLEHIHLHCCPWSDQPLCDGLFVIFALLKHLHVSAIDMWCRCRSYVHGPRGKTCCAVVKQLPGSWRQSSSMSPLSLALLVLAMTNYGILMCFFSERLVSLQVAVVWLVNNLPWIFHGSWNYMNKNTIRMQTNNGWKTHQTHSQHRVQKNLRSYWLMGQRIQSTWGLPMDHKNNMFSGINNGKTMVTTMRDRGHLIIQDLTHLLVIFKRKWDSP